MLHQGECTILHRAATIIALLFNLVKGKCHKTRFSKITSHSAFKWRQSAPVAEDQIFICIEERIEEVLLSLNFQASSCHHPFTRAFNNTTGCMFPYLLGVANVFRGMAITM
jgi:hypothetical protein